MPQVAKGIWKITPGVLVGDRTGAANGAALKELGVTHVVNLAGKSFDDLFASDLRIVYMNCRVLDSREAKLPLDDATEFIEAALSAAPPETASSKKNKKEEISKRVLVHCSGAHSRSLSIACAYLLRCAEAESLKDALQLVEQERGLQHINPGFLEQLAEWETICTERRRTMK